MTPMMIAWLAAVAGGATVGKILGTFLRGKSLGTVLNPIVSLIGGVAAWQAAVIGGLAPPTEWLPAALFALIGGAVALFVASRFKTASSTSRM